jgi:hypothetical protein
MPSSSRLLSSSAEHFGFGAFSVVLVAGGDGEGEEEGAGEVEAVEEGLTGTWASAQVKTEA